MNLEEVSVEQIKLFLDELGEANIELRANLANNIHVALSESANILNFDERKTAAAVTAAERSHWDWVKGYWIDNSGEAIGNKDFFESNIDHAKNCIDEIKKYADQN